MEILLRELDPNQKYIFQARAKSVTGKTSSWSTAFEHTTLSDTTAPSPVSALVWESVGTSFVATWTKPATDSNGKPLKDFKDYKVTISSDSDTVTYYVSQEKIDFSLEANRNSFGSPDPELDISVQVRDMVGNLSVAATDTAINPVPEDVTGLLADGVNNGVALTWDAISDADLKYYEVYVSTSGSGFTPGPSNLVYTGPSTSFLLPATTYVPHYFKVRAVDAFDQGSVNYASATATPESSSGVDLTPPDDPTNVDVTTMALSDGSSSITVDWDAVASSNLSDYLVRYSTDELAWRYINVPESQTSALITNLLTSTAYYVQVAAMSQANVKSDFVNADVYPITTASDTTPPSKPSAPVVSTTTLAVQISHDMTKNAGGDLENDVAYLEVHASTTSGFSPDNTTLRGSIDTAGPGIDVSGVFYFPATESITNLYWKVIAVDRVKNKSTPSDQATGVPGLVLNANIANATITSAKIQSLEANKITAGTGIINDLSIKSSITIDAAGQLKSSNYNGTDTGYSLSNTGLTIYNGTISAGALQLQDSVNIMLPAFADFEFNEDYYHTSGIANPTVMSTVGTGVTLDIIDTDKRFGSKCLKLSNAVITNPTVHDLVFASGGLSATGVNIELSPGVYIFSGYFKKNGSVNALVKFGLYPETGSAIVSSASAINSTTWTRFEAQLTVPSGVSRAKAYLEFGPDASNVGYDFLVDGLQVERKMTGATAAGPWRPPSKTTIDGGQIVTGSIRSSSVSTTDSNQPAWSINTAGNMQVGDALVRGSIVVGASSTSSLNIVPDQFASFEQDLSYYTNPANFGDPPSTGTTFTFEQTGGSVGSKYFRASSATMTSSSQENIFFAPATVTSVSTNNIIFTPGKKYIVSGYVKNFDATKSTQVNFSIWENSTSWFAVDHDLVTAGTQRVDMSAMTTWTRISGIWTANSTGSGKLVVEIKPIGATVGFNVGIDGLMIEEAAVGQTTPSTWVAGFSDSSFISSANYLPGQTGWKIDARGNAEFNRTLIRGAFETKSELGSVEINLLEIRPTIKLWNSTFNNFAWINVVDDTAGRADIGINQGPHDSYIYPGTSIYSRLFMLGSEYDSHIGFVKQSDQTGLGGQLWWNDRQAGVRVFDSASTVKSQLFLSRLGQAYMSNSDSKVEIQPAGNIDLNSGSSAWINMSKSAGYILLQGGLGATLSGRQFWLGGTYDFFRVGTGDWVDVTINSGSGFASNGPQVKLLPDGTCIMRGGITGHSTVAAVIATLPVGYRPARAGRWVCATEGTADNNHVGIATNGQISIVAKTGVQNNSWFTQIVFSTI